MGKRELTEEQRQATRDRREKFRGIVRQIGKMSDADRLELAGRLPGLATCEGHGLSFHNTLLIATQYPTATVVGGFQQWRRQGRQVRKGEHGFMVWAPTNPTGSAADDVPQPSDLNGEEQQNGRPRSELRFIAVTMFDISQTDEVSDA